MESDIGIEMIKVIIFFLLKVNWMVIKTPNGVTVRMMTSSIVKVSFIKAIMEINIAIKIILTTLLVLKVS